MLWGLAPPTGGSSEVSVQPSFTKQGQAQLRLLSSHLVWLLGTLRCWASVPRCSPVPPYDTDAFHVPHVLEAGEGAASAAGDAGGCHVTHAMLCKHAQHRMRSTMSVRSTMPIRNTMSMHSSTDSMGSHSGSKPHAGCPARCCACTLGWPVFSCTQMPALPHRHCPADAPHPSAARPAGQRAAAAPQPVPPAGGVAALWQHFLCDEGELQFYN